MRSSDQELFGAQLKTRHWSMLKTLKGTREWRQT